MKSPQVRCSIIDRVCLCTILGLCALAGCEKKPTAADNTPAPAPVVNPHSVTLTWAPSKSKVAGYNVYRAPAPQKPAKKLAEKPVKLTDGIVLGTEYSDNTVEPGRTYIYYVTSVDLTGLEGVSSKGIEVTVPEAPSETPPAKR